ncbi:uncharacterized protein LOC110179973 [Drosophila serrata]|uniref:uncharacterized protein LOC110179973 n=1 Tax=Drosophila serrata TaxID=7274 RepID=UPI000A1CF5D5|nr:uncharacterized protein LOC110179973 [Drosophila serrata]
MYAPDDFRAYRRARTAFSAKVYGLLILWLVLALIQWMVVCLIEDARSAFRKYWYISLIAFALAILLLAIFIFADGLRFMQFLNFIISLLIVEFQIIATFILVVLSWWADVLVFFVVAAALIFIFLLIGIILPRRVDLTLDIAVLFIIAFIFLIIAVFVLTLLVCISFPRMYTYLVVELAVTLTILLFVIYHAQTIHGNRFAEMRLNDFFLGSLILFHDFLIIFWLTFYWQIRHRFITPDSWIASSHSPDEKINQLGKNLETWPIETISLSKPGTTAKPMTMASRKNRIVLLFRTRIRTRTALSIVRLQEKRTAEVGPTIEEIRESTPQAQLPWIGPFSKEELKQVASPMIHLLRKFESLSKDSRVLASCTRFRQLTAANFPRQRIKFRKRLKKTLDRRREGMDQNLNMELPKEKRKLALANHLSFFLCQIPHQILILPELNGTK